MLLKKNIQLIALHYYRYIYKTGITIIPDLANTQVSLLMLGDNNIQLFPHNYTVITTWPTQLTHV